MGVVDGQWAVKYDSSKLKFNMADNKADGQADNHAFTVKPYSTMLTAM